MPSTEVRLFRDDDGSTSHFRLVSEHQVEEPKGIPEMLELH